MSTGGSWLALRALGLGDLLAGVPALRALRRAAPDGRLWLAAPEVLTPLVELAGVADALVPTPDLGPVPWPAAAPAPDLAVDLHGNGPASKIPLQELRPARLLAFAGPGAGGHLVVGPEWRREEHERERWCRLVREGLGVPADPTDLLVRRPPGAARPGTGPVVVHPGAASGSRRWPPDRFARVAEHLAAHGPVVVTGSAAERPLADDVRRAAGLPPEALLAGRTDLLELAALVAGARLLVCGDTGIAHLASAFGTPSVVLFGPTPPALWGPPDDGPHRVLWHGSGTDSGDPHASDPDPRLLRVTVEEVLDAAGALV